MLPSVLALALSLAAAKPAPRPPVKKPAVTAAKTVIRPVAKKRPPPRPKVIDLVQVNTHETFKLRFTDDRGRPIAGLQKRANKFFRCHHTQVQGHMHPRLLRLLFDVGRHYPGQHLEVVSGYRHPTVAKNPRSPHMKGFACDFRVTGVKNTELRDYLRRAFQHIGVGYYPNSSFVHLDVRQGPSAFWIDYSGPGENALYSDNASEDLKSGRADTFRPTRIDPAWAEREDPPEPPASASGSSPDAGTGAPGQATSTTTSSAPGQTGEP